jgi:light-regulated signal transduction histidine kinase (bacteriophytochrome)
MQHPNGRIFGIVCAAQDISALKRTEDALRQSMAELARSNADLEQFAYVASHDLQEPLRMVTSYVQLLAKRYTGKLDTTADEFIQYAVEGTMRMQRLIQGLLAYSRVGSQGRPFEPTDCSAVIDQVCTNLKVAIEETEATVASNGLPTVMADTTQVTQLFQNLIANAIKFRKPGEPPHVQLKAVRHDQEWLFSISDNGIGLHPKHANRIFALFQRLHAYAEYPGSGIGLAICKKIVERHGGHIWAESQPNDGATFFFTLPMVHT